MNDPLIAIGALERLLASSKTFDSTQHPGLFAAMAVLARDLQTYTDDKELPGSAYISEKILDFEWNFRAMFGMDTDNGHSFESHWGWAYGNLQNLRSLFEELKKP